MHSSTAALPRCRLLDLPAELREQIWIHAVTEWTSIPLDTKTKTKLLEKDPIRMDRWNRPLPAPITRTCTQIRSETLHLYYQNNIFECWRPLFWQVNWHQSTFLDWIIGIGAEKRGWLREVVLLYKHEAELEHDLEAALEVEGIPLGML